MKNIKNLNLFYAGFLIICGLILIVGGFVEKNELKTTALLPGISGMILLTLNNGLAKGNRIVIQMAVVLTLLNGILVGYLFLKGFAEGIDLSRSNVIYFLISFVTFIVMIIYVSRFVDYKRKRRLNDKR
jgi:hypothetical protein